MKNGLARGTAVLCAAALCTMLSGCKPHGAAKTAGPVNPGTKAESAAASVPDSGTLGSVLGNVKFSGAPPARVPIDMSQDPACALAGGQNLSEQYVVSKGGDLANVFVYVKDAPNVGAPDPTPVVIDQHGCQFVPHVAAVQAGGVVEFRNSDPTMHNVHMVTVAGKSMDVSQGPGSRPEDVHFDTAANMLPVRCNNHPWMQALLNVSPNRFFAVTGPDGQFRITGLPAGTYTLAFVHEKLGEHDMKITVSPLNTTPVSYSYSGEK